MCLPGQPPSGPVREPATATEAAAMARTALAWLAGTDAAALTTAEQAECLHGLEQAESAHTAARASVLAAFRAADGCRDDGHSSPKTWLKWKTRITPGAATGAMGWMRRLAAHPLVAGALADGKISTSWAKWNRPVPADGTRRARAGVMGWPCWPGRSRRLSRPFLASSSPIPCSGPVRASGRVHLRLRCQLPP
jgi:hypothetical protein